MPYCLWACLASDLRFIIASSRSASSIVSPPSRCLWYFRDVVLDSSCSFRSIDKAFSSCDYSEDSTATWRVPRIKDSKRGFEALLRSSVTFSSHWCEAYSTWPGFFSVRGMAGRDRSSSYTCGGAKVFRFFKHLSQLRGHIPDFFYALLIVNFVSVCSRIHFKSRRKDESAYSISSRAKAFLIATSC